MRTVKDIVSTFEDADVGIRDLLLICLVGLAAPLGAVRSLTGARGDMASLALPVVVLCLSFVFDVLLLRRLIRAVAARRAGRRDG